MDENRILFVDLDGTLIDTEKVKNIATRTRNNISPKTGTLRILQFLACSEGR